MIQRHIGDRRRHVRQADGAWLDPGQRGIGDWRPWGIQRREECVWVVRHRQRVVAMDRRIQSATVAMQWHIQSPTGVAQAIEVVVVMTKFVFPRVEKNAESEKNASIEKFVEESDGH